MDRRYYRREFINLPGFHSTAYVYAEVERSTRSDEYAATCTLALSDCSRKISISIDLDSPGERQNSLHKLDVLIETLIEFRRAVRRECIAQERRESKAVPDQAKVSVR